MEFIFALHRGVCYQSRISLPWPDCYRCQVCCTQTEIPEPDAPNHSTSFAWYLTRSYARLSVIVAPAVPTPIAKYARLQSPVRHDDLESLPPRLDQHKVVHVHALRRHRRRQPTPPERAEEGRRTQPQLHVRQVLPDAPARPRPERPERGPGGLGRRALAAWEPSRVVEPRAK